MVTSATFGLIPLFTLPLFADGLNVPSILCYRFLLAAVLMGVFMAGTGRAFKVNRKEFGTLAGLSILYIGSAVFFVLVVSLFGKRHSHDNDVFISCFCCAYYDYGV